MPDTMTDLGLQGNNPRFELTFGPLLVTAILYMRFARTLWSGALS